MIYYYIIFAFIKIGFTWSGGPRGWSGRRNVKERKARWSGAAELKSGPAMGAWSVRMEGDGVEID